MREYENIDICNDLLYNILMSTDAITILSRRNYHVIERAMLHDPHQTSFTELMADFRGLNPVDIYALTAISAIPVADAVRGYFDELPSGEPNVIGLTANRGLSRLSDHVQADEMFIEACKIGPDVRQKTIGVIDQYVATGATLQFAVNVLRTAGAKGIRANTNVLWYDQAVPTEVDLDNLTSEHAQFMREVGQKAAQAAIRSGALIY